MHAWDDFSQLAVCMQIYTSHHEDDEDDPDAWIDIDIDSSRV